MGRQRHRSEGNGRGLTPSQPDDRDSAPPGRSERSTGGGDRSSQIISPPPKPSLGVAGGPIGVYRPDDRLTPPALRGAAGDITSPRTGSSSLPCPRRPHELRGSTIPSRRSFFGFAPVDGAHSELTRQRAPLFPRSTQKLAQCTVAWTLVFINLVNRLLSLTPPLSDNSKGCRADRHSDPTPNDTRNLVLWRLFPKLRFSCQQCQFANPLHRVF
jgi:hypothetical protein